MYALYSFFFFLALILYTPFYAVRTWFFRREKIFLRNRLGFGLPEVDPSRPSLWIHAVSVGEVLSLQNLVHAIRERHPDWIISFSTMTNTGYRMAREKLKDADWVLFLPLDFARVTRRFFQKLNPRVFVLAESEFWPNLLREAKRDGRSVLLINGRISQRSFRKYRRFRRPALKILSYVDRFLVQTDQDKDRLERIGVAPDRVETAGNLKCEVNLPAMSRDDIRALKHTLGISENSKIVTAGSTRNGEEEMLTDAFLEARKERNELVLILAPRHPERVAEVEKICRDRGLDVRRRTEASSLEPIRDVLLLDTLGELAQVYSLADAAFVGGSLVPWGGHNLLEPAFFAKPVFFGPYMENFSFLAGEFIRAHAARVVENREDLKVMFLMNDKESLTEMGRKAKTLMNSLQGATERTIRAVEFFMSDTGLKKERL